MNVYSLEPFTPIPQPFTVNAYVSKLNGDESHNNNQNCIQIIFRLVDLQQHVAHHLSLLTENQAIPSNQQDYLWQSTCFEVFIQPENSTAYFEVNLSTSGAWNVYSFDEYRSPKQMPPRRAEQPVLQHFTVQPDGVTAVLDLSFLDNDRGAMFKLGLTSVMVQKDDTVSYWALQHGVTADFHRAEDWLLTF